MNQLDKEITHKPKVCIIYHFFAHYRGAVLQELLDSDSYNFFFAGAAEDPQHSGIKAWDKLNPQRFILTHCKYIKGIMFQSKVIALSLRPDIRTLIFMGDMHFITTWVGAALARLLGKRVYFWTHGWTRHEKGISETVRSAFYRLAHGLLLYGHYAKSIGVEKGFDPERLHVIYNSLDYETQKSVREKVTQESAQLTRSELFPLTSAHPLIVYSARLIQGRRIDVLLEAMGILKQEGHQVNLLIIGDGPERQTLEEQAQKQNLSSHFFGPCYDESVLARLIMSANVTVSPGPVGLTAIHSLAYGTPVITHNNYQSQKPEFEAIIPNVTGEFYTEKSSSDLARAIKAWTQTTWVDDDLRQKCYTVVDKFYNPSCQRALIERALRGEPADDSEWRSMTGANSDHIGSVTR